MNWPWSELGLSGPAELPEIRRAYAQRLKATHPEEDPDGFQRLHDAYQQACRIARRQKKQTPAPAPEPEHPAGSGPFPEPEPFHAFIPPDFGAESGSSRWKRAEESRTQEGTEKDSGPRESKSEACSKEQSEEKDSGGEREGKTGSFSKEQTEEPRKPPRDWDFERLFAEGEEEAQAARRRRIEELREKNRARFADREREQRRRAENDREAWEAVMAAAHALELLVSTGAPLPQWQDFLQSQVFWNVRGNLDFLFAMEDFLEQNPDLPKAVRKAIFTAYGFSQHVKPEQRRLCRLLDVDRKERWRLRWSSSPLRKQWQSWPPRRRFATVFGVVFLALLTVIACWDLIAGAGAAMGSLFPSWQKEMCAQLEADYGRAFIHPYKEGEYIFAPADEPDLLFFACREKDGYRTNYPDRLVMDQLELFAWKWNLALDFDSAGEGYKGQLGETPGGYLFQLPLTGAGEAISELGELLAALSEQDWYQRQVPDFEVFLCYGTLHFYSARSTEESFDAAYARTLYENKFGPELCRYIAGHSGTAEADLGKDAYVLMEQGTVTLGEEGALFFWVTGMSMPPESVPLSHYFLSSDGKQLYAVSDAMLNGGFTLEELRQKGVRKIQILPELGEHSSIEVWDLVQAAGPSEQTNE